MRSIRETYNPIPGWKPMNDEDNQKIFQELLEIENEGIKLIPKSPIKFFKPGNIGR